MSFLFFFLRNVYKASLDTLRKKKNKNDIIYEKLRVPTSEREGKLSNPRARPASVMHEENLRKFTEPARRPRTLCSNFFIAKNTVDRRVLHPATCVTIYHVCYILE